ncbi:TetR family transcriptional regulator [Nonomuraea phyllanthi]|uniref:TetR family transcriptional regulator n=2 Tax=Nonomuraea phyllanthi TaxID=2219224 RepID=A0A5C4VIY2_9ACTN|nr:TetR family transcriptional regulator [Nonomuraea phyllanthi]
MCPTVNSLRTVPFGSAEGRRGLMELRSREDAKVRQIRQAAKALFLRHGFAAVSTAALAREAGVSKETLYSRYPNKEAVLADVLEHLISAGRLRTSATSSPRTRDEVDGALRSLARELSGELMEREYIELARIVIAETPRLPHVGEIFRLSVPERAFELTTDLLMAGRKAHVIRDLDMVTAARLFVGPLVVHALTNVLLVAPQIARDTPTPPLDVDKHVDVFLTTVLQEER